MVGLTIESEGPEVTIGELCEINELAGRNPVKAEVVGFRENKVLLMPLGDMGGIGPGSKVVAMNRSFQVAVSENMIGRILDGMGNPIDGYPLGNNGRFYPVNNSPPHPLQRKDYPAAALGIKAIDGLLTVGKGQG